MSTKIIVSLSCIMTGFIVKIGAALVDKGYAKANQVRGRFQSKPALIPWLDEWKTYEADYLDID